MVWEVLTGGKSFASLLLVIFLRYLIIAALAFLVFYVVRREAWRFRRIQGRFPRRKDYWREIGWSVSTAFIFALGRLWSISYAVVRDTRLSTMTLPNMVQPICG